MQSYDKMNSITRDYSLIMGQPTHPIRATLKTACQEESKSEVTATEDGDTKESRNERMSSRNRGGDSSRVIGVSSSDEEMTRRLEGLEVEIGRAESEKRISSSRKYFPISVRNNIFLSIFLVHVFSSSLYYFSLISSILLSLPRSLEVLSLHQSVAHAPQLSL